MVPSIIHREPMIFLRNFPLVTSLPKMVRNFTARRAGGSETALRSQPGSHGASQSWLLGVPKESGVPPFLLLLTASSLLKAFS